MSDKITFVETIKREAERIGHGKIKIEVTVQTGLIKYIRIVESERQIKCEDII